MLRYWTAGESHGKALVALVDGFPAGVELNTDDIDVELRRRQGGYGRGGRQRIETDRVDILSGIWQGRSIGSPVALQVVNRDSKLERLGDLDRPRPGHGDLTGTAAINVTITDPLNPVLTFVSATNGGTLTGNTVTWDLGIQTPNVGGSVCVDAFVNAYP